jgi:cytochrome c553
VKARLFTTLASFTVGGMVLIASTFGAEAPKPAAPVPATAPASASAPTLASTAASGRKSPASDQLGSQIAHNGASGAAACIGCHGASGEGNAQANFPRLAGLGQRYLRTQLDSYADGRRSNPIMGPIAKALNESQRDAVTGYYAGLKANPSAAPSTDAAPRAIELAIHGDDKLQVQACANCHGPQGIGDAGVMPYLAGQHPGYLTAAMSEFKNGSRRNDPSGQMPAIASALPDADVDALVKYFASLPPPQPGNAQAIPASFRSGTPARTSGPTPGASKPDASRNRSGTEQGSPSDGGSQGQGSGAGTAPVNPKR